MGKSKDKKFYAVVFEGKILPGHDEAAVKQNLAGLFKASVKDIEKRLFSGKRIVIRKNLTRAQAEDVREQLNKLGADCVIVAMRPPAVRPALSPAAVPETKKKVRRALRVAALAFIVGGLVVAAVLWLPYYSSIFSSGRTANLNKTAVREYSPGITIAEDLAMMSVSVPRSEWQEGEQKLYWELLRRKNYDVLVVPFQVHYYGIDRAGRSLMTRYLADRIGGATRLTVADPTLVARALGERSRRYDFRILDKLATDLKVRYLVMGFVGHNRDDKMKLQIIVKEYNSDEKRKVTNLRSMFKKIASETPTDGMYSSLFKDARTAIDMKDIAFSDERPPSEVFRERLEEVVSKLPMDVLVAQDKKYYERVDTLEVPENMKALVEENSSSPVINAYYLQFIGVLYPDKTASMENLFERSLVALQQVSPESPDFRLLKARALFYLYRRPAAIEALGTPETPAEKAFLAYLNGNLSQLREWTEQISSPLHKLMSIIELSNLKSIYTKIQPSQIDAENIVSDYPGWALLLIHRVYRDNVWFAPSNINVKAGLDEAFPVEGETAEELAAKYMMFGKFIGSSEIDFSVYNHVTRLIDEKGEEHFLDVDPVNPRSGDYIDILNKMGESNLLHLATKRILAQALYEEAIKTIESYEEVYNGHPMMTYMKAAAMRRLNQNATGVEKQELGEQSSSFLHNAMCWFQGQFYYPTTDYQAVIPYYKDDFPHNAYFYTVSNAYHVAIKDEEIKQAVEKLSGKLSVNALINYHDNKYTYWDFDSVKMMLDIFGDAGLDRAVEVVKAKNSHRFDGNPLRYSYFGKIEFSEGDWEGAKAIYRGFIATVPTNWAPYQELIRVLSIEGNYNDALNVFQSYPLFEEDKSRDTVALSNKAYSAGRELAWRGGFRESVPMFELSASYQTRSGAEMSSSAYLALIKRDYAGAILHFNRLSHRYNDLRGQGSLISLLHISGRHEEAQEILNSMTVPKRPFPIYWAIMVGRRMQRKSPQETFEWLLKRDDLKSSFYLPLHLVLDGCTDRMPNDELIKMISRNDYYPVDFNGRIIPDFKKDLADFVEAYIAFREGNYNKAYSAFVGMSGKNLNWIIKENAYLYASISAIRIGRGEELPILEKKFGILQGSWTTFSDSMIDSSLHGIARKRMVEAYRLGNAKNHSEAVEKLKLARGLAPMENTTMMSPTYQVVEIAEWLYEESGYDEYRKLAVELARDYQRIYPWYAWTYAVEANLAEFPQDRVRALAITLYLDEDSERISHFSNKEKDEALRWLERNNPFLKG